MLQRCFAIRLRRGGTRAAIGPPSRRRAGIATLLAPACDARAQLTRFEPYGAEQGLGTLSVSAIAQDVDGAMLLGTQSGLYRFDGETLAPFHPGGALAADAWIGAVAVDPAGRSWAVTAGGLFWRRGGAFRAVAPPPGGFARGPHVLAALGASVVVLDAERRLLRAPVAQGGVGALAPLFPATGPRAAPAGFVAPDGRGGLLFGCGDALCRTDPALRPSRLGAAEGLPADRWVVAVRGPDGSIWTRSLTRLARLRPGADRFEVTPVPGTHASFGLDHETELALVPDRADGVLTQGDDGYLRWDGRSWHAFPHHAGGAPDAILLAFAFDRDGALWLGSLGAGAYRSRGYGAWEHRTTEDGLPSDAIWTIARAPRGALWLATDAGVAALGDPATVSGPGYTVAATRDGRIWAAPAGAPLARFDPAAGARVPLGAVRATGGLAVDRDDRLWFATAHAVMVLDDADADPATVRPREVAAASKVTSFTVDRDGAVWFASRDGVFRWRAATGLARLVPPGSITGRPVMVALAPDGAAWVATMNDGVQRFGPRGNGFARLPPLLPPELPSAHVPLLASDRRGRMWVGTDRGIGLHDGRSWRWFDAADGPITDDLDQQSVLEDTDGSMWFGTSRGLSHLLDAADLPPPAPPRPPVVTRVSLGDAPIAPAAPAAPMVAPWRRGPLSVRFEDFDFAAGPLMRFRYRIEAPGRGWTETDRREIRIAEPPTGAFTLALVGVDPATRLASAPVRLSFRIGAPWWRDRPFRVSVALLAVALLAGFSHLRRRARRRRKAREASLSRSIRQQQRLEEMVSARTAEIEQARHEMQQLAMSDILTGLPNRRALMIRLEAAIRDARDASRPLAAVLWDIDHFKGLNDQHGHGGGDEVLAAFGTRLAGALEAGESAGRYGGEEFLLVIEGEPKRAALRAEAIRGAVTAQPYRIAGAARRITVSGGFALLRPADTAESLVRRADTALYEAKAAGRDRIARECDESEASRRAELARDLRAAVPRGELGLRFQPVVDVERDRLVSCEALLHWNSPTRGYMPPAGFVPFAERHNLMADIDGWVLDAACREAASWPGPLRVSVNLSPAHFPESCLVDLIAAVLARTGLPPCRLELEVTETAMIADVAAAAATLARLRGLGIRIALDDFGTGYSSLSFASALPFDRIKIDRSFVRNLGVKPQATAIIRSVVQLCRGIGAAVTAEGVETQAQLDMLRALGCAEQQGFIIARPLSAAEIRARIPAGDADPPAPGDRVPP